MIIWTRNTIKSNAKINFLSNTHDAIKKLKLRAIENNKHKKGYKNQDTKIVIKINWDLN